ncbi:unnamed protein product [Umbelopsis sp. WA50703]
MASLVNYSSESESESECSARVNEFGKRPSPFKVKCRKEIYAILEKINIPDVIVDCPDDGCHVSLSKCLYLKEFQFDTFKGQITKGLTSVKPFSLAFAAVAPLTNEVGTRSFCSLEVGYGYNEVRYNL